MNVTHAARIAHEVSRSYLAITGDDSVEPWEKASDEEREGMIFSVRAVAQGFATPEGSHDAWVREMARNGWTHGDRIDSEAKKHPHMTTYASLPLEVRTRDALIVAVARGALGGLVANEAVQ